MCHAVTLKNDAIVMQRHSPAAGQNDTRLTRASASSISPAARQVKPRKVHGLNSASAIFITGQLAPQAIARPTRSNSPSRG